MTTLKWDQPGERTYETGVSKGVLYLQNNGIYDTGVAWNGLTTLTESPSSSKLVTSAPRWYRVGSNRPRSARYSVCQPE